MTRESVASVLREIPFFSGVSEDLIRQLAEMGQIVEHPAGSVVFRQGDPATTLHLVVSGQILLEICASGVGCKRLLTVGSGELLGYSTLLGESRLTATARAVTEAETLQFSGPQVLALCQENPRFGYECMRQTALALAKRLNGTRLQLLDIYGHQMPHAPDERAQEA